MKKKNTNKSANMSKSTSQKKTNASKSTYNLDEYRTKKSSVSKSNSSSYDRSKRNSQDTTKKYSSSYTRVNEGQKNRYNPYDRRDNVGKTTTSSYQDPYETIYSHSYNNTSYSNSYNNSYTGYNNTSYTNSKTKSPEAARQEIKQKNKISRKEAEAIRKKKKVSNRNKFILIVMAVIFGVYGTTKLIDLFIYPTISYQTVRSGMIDNSQKVQGIIVREEQIYTSTVEGNVHYITGEGQKVKKDGEVCYVTKDEELSKVTDQIEEVDKSIYNIQDKRENLSEYQTEIYNLNSHITSEIKDFYNNRSSEKTNPVYTLRKQLDRIVQTRTELYVNESTDRTEGLQQNRLELSKELKNYQNIVKAKEAGIVSYIIDGHEQSLKSSEIENIDFATYHKLMKGDKLNEINKSVGETANDLPLYKLVVDDKWQIVTYIDTELATQFVQDKTYDLIFSDMNNTKVSFRLNSKVEEGGKTRLIFITRDQVVKFLPYRAVEFTIGENKADGLKIPLSAIVEKNVLRIPSEYIVDKEKQQGVMKKTGELVEFIPINIQYTSENSSYILQDLGNLGSVQVDETIIKPDSQETFKVSEVEAVQGVYTINGRYAKFKGVDIILTNEGYAIIRENSELKEFDQIISNPKSIKEDQLLKSMNIQNE